MHNRQASALDLFKKGQNWIQERSEGQVLSKSQYLKPGQRLGLVNPADNRKQFLIHSNMASLTSRKASLKLFQTKKDVGTNR